jgi:hypothetical protein
MTDSKKPSLLDQLRAKQTKPAESASTTDAPQKPVFPRLLSKSPAIQAQQPVVTQTAETPAAPALPTAPKAGSLLAAAAKGVEKQKAAEQDYAYLHTELPTDVKELCDRFDEMMARDQGIDVMNLGLARAYVKKIMVMLKENPEFDGLIIDRDVHNIMAFVRSTREQAVATINTKAEKSAKAAANKAKKTNRFGSIEAIDFGGLPAKGAISLEALKDVEF